MIRTLLATLSSAMPCRPHLSLGRASALFSGEGTGSFSGGKFVNEGIVTVIAGWLNPDRLIQSGKCRAS